MSASYLNTVFTSCGAIEQRNQGYIKVISVKSKEMVENYFSKESEKSFVIVSV